MPAADLVKRSVTIQGHRTSVSLEPVFWDALVAAAKSRGQPLNALVAEIDEARTTNLSSAIRVWLFERARAHAAPGAPNCQTRAGSASNEDMAGTDRR